MSRENSHDRKMQFQIAVSAE